MKKRFELSETTQSILREIYCVNHGLWDEVADELSKKHGCDRANEMMEPYWEKCDELNKAMLELLANEISNELLKTHSDDEVIVV